MHMCVDLLSLLMTLSKYLSTETLDILFAIIHGVFRVREDVKLFDNWMVLFAFSQTFA